MKQQFLSLIFLFFASFSFAHNGILVGKILDEKSGLPVEYALVTINPKQGELTGADGRFIFENLESGEYTLTITMLGYEKKEIKAVVKEHETTDLLCKLTPKNLELKEVVISGNRNQTINTISKMDIALRPSNSAQDLLRIAPGLFIAQHAGGGKAEQIFMRGFDCDHGTDIALTVDGMPVNMTSHAHGQGYADLHFLMPEVVERADVQKGSYDASIGNLATAGSVAFHTKNYLDKNTISLEAGMFGHTRLVTMFNLLGEKARENQQNWYVAGEYLFRKGFFQNPDNLNRLNIFTKYQGLIDEKNILTADFSHFNSFWNASGQIPDSEVENGNITRFGSLDNSEGGNTSRTNVNLQLLTTISSNQYFKNQVFVSKYDFDLFSNFTFFLNDSINGDGIHQKEKRTIYGYKGAYHQSNTMGKVKFNTEIGANIRMDDIKNSELSHVKRRNIFISPLSLGDIQDLNAGIDVNENIEFNPRLLLNLGARLDAFSFNYNDKLDSTGYQRREAKKLTPSPKMSLYYTANHKLQFFVNSGIGFHSNDTRVVVAQNGLQTLPKSFGGDIGVDFKPASSLFAHVALWGLFLQQEFVYVGDEAIVEPSGQTQRTGIDISFRWQPLRWLSADLDMNYARPRALGGAENEIYIPLAPTLTSIGGIKAEVSKNLFVTLRYRYLADRPANEDNSLIAKGYFVMDGAISYTAKKFDIGFFVENATNTKWKEAQFETESRVNALASPQTQIHFTAGTPFSGKVRLSYHF